MPDDQPTDANTDALPRAEIVRARRRSWLWILPLLAVAASAFAFYQSLAERGPAITLRLADAYGLSEGDPVRHRGVQVGAIESISITEDLTQAIATVRLTTSATNIARTGSEFWVVRADISLQGVRGLETIIGPNYIAVRPGNADATPLFAFDVLPEPPQADPTANGSLAIEVWADQRGPLTVGSPVRYRGIPVGRITKIALGNDATAVIINAVIDPRYTPLVRDRSRFWVEGGISADFGLFSGLSLRAESLETVVSGGIAFATPNRTGDPVRQGHRFAIETLDNDWLDWDPSIPLAPPSSSE